MCSFRFSFTIFDWYFLKSTKKAIWDFNSTWHISKAIKTTYFLENMLIGMLSIFLAFNLVLSFHSSFISYRKNYACTWSIFILAYRRYYFNNSNLSRSLYSRIVFYTDAHPYEKSGTTFKRRKTAKERKASVLISLFGATCLITGYVLAANPLYFMSLGDIIGLLYAVSSIFVIPSLISAGTYFSFHRLASCSFAY